MGLIGMVVDKLGYYSHITAHLKKNVSQPVEVAFP